MEHSSATRNQTNSNTTVNASSKVKGSGWIGALKRSLQGRKHDCSPRKHYHQPLLQPSDAAPVSICNTDLPLAIWMDHIFPLLDRAAQNSLAEAHSDIAAARRCRSGGKHVTMDWPRGKIAKRFSRPVKQVTFVPTQTATDYNKSDGGNHQDLPSDTLLLVAYCKPKVISCDRLAGPNHSRSSQRRTSSPVMDPATTPHAHKGIVADLQVCPTDASLLATASKNDGTVRLWKLTIQTANNNNHPTYECIRILQIHQHDLRHMAWSPRGDKIVSWGYDGFIRVSTIDNGAMQSRFWKTRIEVVGCHRTVAFDPTGTFVAFAHNNDCVYLWELATDKVSFLPGGGSWDEHGCYAGAYVGGVAYSPDGRLLVVGCHVALLKVWTIVAYQGPAQLYQEGENHGYGQLEEAQQGSQSLEYIFEKEIHVGGGWSAVTLLTFEPKGRYLACTNNGSQIRIVDTLTDQVVTTLEGHTGRIESLCFTSDGRTLASGACDRTVRFWDTSRLYSDTSAITTPMSCDTSK